MKKEVSPVVVVAVLAVIVVALGLFFWKQSSGPGGTSGGRMKSDLGPMETDPDKLKKGVEELLAQDKKGK